MKKTQVRDIVNHFQLKVVSGKAGLRREITVSDISRPGLEMAGYFNFYAAERIQLLGKTELGFFVTLGEAEREERINKLLDEKTPCICIAHGCEVPEELIRQSEARSIPVLISSLPTTKLSSKLTTYLEGRLAPTTTMHGVLVDVYGVGVLLVGQSAIGKSETALELVKRGHRLVADDAVEIRQTQENQLIGSAPELIQHLLEIRGLGIINVMTLFGAGAVRNYKRISLVIRLEIWDPQKVYDRLGLDEEKLKIMDAEVPQITIPVRPGRNLAVIVEVAAMNFRLKRMGYNAAVVFSKKLTDTIEEAVEDI
ncbi:HPr(Ser) kinase/phosphatase [Aneurinibacillus thermoaerophilus]|uniref:HPr kinase/phosphorylase n=1 Tax=Aneurinibacillus thermoaerophilus TaxID=143495 RepID=A0A1G8EA29_ANETH|nr:HPr(Ser) kinase/phosphatase [Aneurinibacillus thermoaerophilus]MED0676897.1 HPr(Ser) kinase/phosphatase [Aneurinibacillus thermoaerophilus]MED0680744.1 HPr(Ser) kinase/phosphatase [Aneurinibacillus thermoaerophilus]MED0738767.1 HPr(Ser) kinase/phosphatase [Aneurinibacillus thermoaerophilus]MED0758014.1 HPr(Ser) kinase/phosphatase [Aneurinibacillus thermoaerophilus]MED0762345.1 HPr(Ser) kinase/phosphatase [Aneurinibacillus thermoaerophilus]